MKRGSISLGPWKSVNCATYTAENKIVASCTCEEDAALIAEAGTVYHETGLTPRELSDLCDSREVGIERGVIFAHELTTQRDELLAALTLAANRLHRCTVDRPMGSREQIERSEWAQEAREIISKTQK